jgi:NAD/NADP transhydrogenase beta subunit
VSANTALAVGFFLVPVFLLVLGHRLRDRTTAQRGAFWGGVIGHSIAMVTAVFALHYPAVLWSGPLRVFVAFWLMLIGAVAGAVIGVAVARRRAAT